MSALQEPSEVASLEQAVRQLINLGENDPLDIARKIEARYEESWLRDELWALRQDVFSDIARTRINGSRQTAMKALRSGEPMTKAKLLLHSEWVPNEGWKALSSWTADDLQARADYYRRIASTCAHLADWCEDCAALIEAEGVKTLGKVKADLPELGSDDMKMLNGGDLG